MENGRVVGHKIEIRLSIFLWGESFLRRGRSGCGCQRGGCMLDHAVISSRDMKWEVFMDGGEEAR
jgi:hypothetical protein